MAGLGKQIGAVAAMNIRTIPQRGWMSFASVIAVALAVSVLLFFLALANGLTKTVAGAGSNDVAIVLRDGSEAELNSTVTRDQLEVLSAMPGVAQRNGHPFVSGELLVVVDGKKHGESANANMPFRGISPDGVALRHSVHIAQGRMFRPGTNEIIVGAGLIREFEGFDLGKTIRLRGTDWRVVGVFSAPGSAFESELWADAPLLQSLFDRGSTYQTVRLQMTSPRAVQTLKTLVKNDPRLHLVAYGEREYFERQANASGGGLELIAWILGIVMAIGALAGALNTMYSSVAARAAEIATLRIIGFSGYAAFVGTMAEALILSALGGMLGIALSYLVFNGRTTSTLGANFTQLVFQFQFSPAVIVGAIVLALAIGLLGGILPGISAARTRPQLELAAQ
jgi:putative ABC transport system permease protein